MLVVSAAGDLGGVVESALREVGVPAIVTPVRDCYMALGHIATHSDVPPDTLIADIDDLKDIDEAMVPALRRLAPKCRLVVAAPPVRTDDALNLVHGGFDDYVSQPIDAHVLPHHLGQCGDGRRTASSRALSLLQKVRSGILAGIDGWAQAGAPEAAADDTLGDVDLIDRMLVTCEPLTALAMKLLDQTAGIPGLQWAASDAPGIPEGHVAVPVSFQGVDLGSLHAASVSRDQIAPWAEWLARWLALEQRMDHLWQLALRDELTGVWNRRYLKHFLEQLLVEARAEHFRVTVMVFDIDDFKMYNDRYGHAAGDEILAETARLMNSVVREHDIVARTGGDEFAVVFWDAEVPRQPDSEHPTTIRTAARRFQQAICQHKFPKLAEEAPGTLTISGGLAGYPWDGKNCDDLLDRADEMALQSKRQGKNVVTFGPGALRTCEMIFRPESEVSS